MPAGIGSLWPAEVGTRWTRHDWGRGDGRGEESGTHRRDRLRCSIYAHAARYSGAARHPNSLSGWHSKLHNILLPNKDKNMISWALAKIVRPWLCHSVALLMQRSPNRDFTCKNWWKYIQSWTGPCITPGPCINVTFPPFTTKNIEVFCALHAVNSSS